MNTENARRRRLWLEWSILAAAMTGLVIVAVANDWSRRLDAAIYDHALAGWNRTPSADIVIVGIDEQSLALLGRWPWRRAVHATLMPHLAAARAVLFDLIVAEAETADVEGERALARAIASNGRVVLPVHASVRFDGSVTPASPAPLLLQSAAALGHIQLDVDSDGLVRQVYLYEGPPARLWPHVALAMRELAGSTRGTSAQSSAADRPGGQPVANTASWTRADPSLIAYVGPAGTFTQVPYVAVLRGDVPDAFFRDKFVLVGGTSPGMGDAYPTPGTTARGLMSGVEITANVVQQLQDDIHIRPAEPHIVLAMSLSVVIATLVASLFLSAGARLALTCALAVGLAWSAGVALRDFRAWYAPGTAIVAVLAAFPLWSWRRLAAAQAFVDGELARLDVALRGAGATMRHRGGDPLDRRIEAIQIANEEIRKRAVEREEMISFLTHDLRAPQVSIIALADLYRSNRHGTIDDAFWDRLTAYAGQTLSLADDFVQLARAQALGAETFEPANLAEIAVEAIDDAWAATRSKSISTTRELPPDAWTIGDRALLGRVFRNLLDNAIKHGPPGSTISVRIERIGERWHCSVADEGPGVAAEEREAIFNRYHIARQQRSDAQKAGVGLGLALVKTVAERSGGRAFVEDRVAGGARFVVELPVIATPA